MSASSVGRPDQSAGGLEIRRSRRDHGGAPTILDLNPDAGLRQADPDDHDPGGGRAAVTHAVGHQLRYHQPRALEHGRRDPVAQTLGDNDPRRAGRAHVHRHLHAE
jgi:hypothetical protein